ncbi:YdcF family protein [Paenibacillus sp. 5J-6]|uniref:YdcF family protein n=1 Tax=Paenibacillus silvestris TaxID=2606219 RepID=A0A6L8UUZ3_9BACL|nr:YdcF family protein [Paenibacillus silvestris]MZQ80976.1 YdcF family protein [Paenibacillus silvestris]
MTHICFLKIHEPVACDAIFLFGGSHPGNFEKPLEAYQKKLGKAVIITGNNSTWGMIHPSWNYGDVPQAGVIVSYLISNGVPADAIVYEERSKNSLDNVLFAKEIFNFDKINSLLFITKSYGAGRQWRLLTKHLPPHIRYVPYPFDTNFTDDEPIMTRHNWMNTPKNCSLVYGEYLRIVCYGKKGDITPLDNQIAGLENHVSEYC